MLKDLQKILIFKLLPGQIKIKIIVWSIGFNVLNKIWLTFKILLLLRVLFMLSVTSSKALTYSELSSDFSKSELRLVLWLLLLSGFSSFLTMGLATGTRTAAFDFVNVAFNVVTSAGFVAALFSASGLKILTVLFFVAWFCPPNDVVMAYKIY